MASIEDRLGKLESFANAFQGLPASATISLPHNDSWLFEDNVDGPGGFPANLRYVIANNTQKIVSARLSIHLAPYRTYNTLSVSSTGTESAGHTHGISATHTHTSAGHTHSIHIIPTLDTVDVLTNAGAGTGIGQVNTGVAYDTAQVVNSTTPGATGSTAPGSTDGESATHTHGLSASGVLGVTEGATATGVSISFDGVDATAALGGPFSSDMIELNVRPFIATTQNVWHTIAMTPTGIGRIEAHLRLGVYVSAGQLV